jgi:hypothetical protein
MVVTVRIELAQNETLSDAADVAAGKVLSALKGNVADDYCTVTVIASPIPGSVGTPPPPQAPFSIQGPPT